MQGKKILVIDDDINLCQSIKIDFTRAGATVFTATDGQHLARPGFHVTCRPAGLLTYALTHVREVFWPQAGPVFHSA